MSFSLAAFEKTDDGNILVAIEFDINEEKVKEERAKASSILSNWLSNNESISSKVGQEFLHLVVDSEYKEQAIEFIQSFECEPNFGW